MKNTDKCREC